jgi:HSP20 family protein
MRENGDAPLARRSDILPPFGLRSPPLAAFRHEMDRLFDTFFAPSRFAAAELGDLPFNPAIDLTESEKEVRLRAELPGVEEKDVDIRLEGDVLTIRGEKREERMSEGDHRRVIERSYGSFERSLRLPFEPEDGQVKAEFKNGVLTITAKKPAELARASKRIPITNV